MTRNRFFFRSQDDWKFWIGAALLVKSLWFILLINQGRPIYAPGVVANYTADTFSYLTPVENLVERGSYDPDYRMPGYGIVYLPFYLIFSRATACNLLIIVQLLMASTAVYLLARAALNCFGSLNLFYIVFYVSCLSTYFNLYDTYLLSESFCCSATIFTVYFFSVYIKNKKPSNLLYAGILATWIFFLRPMYLPLLLLFLLVLLYDGIRTHLTKKLLFRNILIFMIPFLTIESAWITRNYMVHKKIIPLTTSLYALDFENSYLLELMDFVNSWGGDRSWWNANSEMRWFGLGQYLSFPGENVNLPTDIYTSQYTIDSLQQIKNYIAIIELPSTSSTVKKKYTLIVKQKLSRYTTSVKKEKKFLYYVKAPLRLFKRFFVHSGTYNLFHKPFNKLNTLEMIVKVFYSGFYVLTLLVGAVGIIFIIFYNYQHSARVMIVSIALYSIVLFPLILRQIEYRYFIPAYPFVLMIACYFSMLALRRIKPTLSQSV